MGKTAMDKKSYLRQRSGGVAQFPTIFPENAPSLDTAFLFGNGAEGVVAVEPEAVFHSWRSARRECLLGGTQ